MADKPQNTDAPLSGGLAQTKRDWALPIKTVADLVNNLLTLDQGMDVYGAYHIDVGPDRCRARGLSLSREHVINDRIKPDESIPYSLVIWTADERRGPEVSSTEQKCELCEYCGNGKRTGLPGNACENCVNTGLKYPERSSSIDREYDPNVAPCDDAEFGMKPCGC